MKNEDLDQVPMNKLFIKEWLNHFNIHYDSKTTDPISGKLDYFISQSNLGIIINEWNKPISVNIINQAVILKEQLGLNELIVVCESIGDYALALSKKMINGVRIILNQNLSELAVEISNLNVFNAEIPVNAT